VLSKNILRSDNGTLTGIVTVDVDHQFNELPGSQRHWQADMILLSMGFLQPEHYPIESVALRLDNRGNFEANNTDFRTSIEKVYAAADCRRGQDLVVRAINEGRQAARSIDTDLMGSSQLP
jgi:glutamate synthase (NADPH/NADH) small chain